MALYSLKQTGGDLLLNTPCFDLGKTLDCGQAFRFEESGGVWQGVVGRRIIKMRQTDEGIIIYNMMRDEFVQDFERYFTLDVDYEALLLRFCDDDVLRRAVKYAGGIRLLRQDKWEALCSFIISQNNNIPRIKTIIGRLCECFGEKIDGGFTFPSAKRIAALSVDDLAPLRAGFRAKYIIDAARKVSSGEVELDALGNMPYDDAAAALMKIKGVGPKVADCVLLFSCDHFEAVPKDVWIKRVLAVLFPDGLPECVGDYAGIAQQYLFYYARETGLGEE